MFHKVKFVAYNPDYKLTIQFSEGVTKIYDLKQVIKKKDHILWKMLKLILADMVSYGMMN